MDGAAVEEWGDSELKLASVRAGGGGVLEVRGGALARERGDWDAGGSPGAKAHERRGAGALPRACHGGGDVTAAQHDRGSVARGGGLQRGWEWGQGVECGGGVAGGGLPAFLSGGGAALRRRQRKQRERERGGR